MNQKILISPFNPFNVLMINLIHKNYYNDIQQQLNDEEKEIIKFLDEYLYSIYSKQIIDLLLEHFISQNIVSINLSNTAYEYLSIKNNVSLDCSNNEKSKMEEYNNKSTITQNIKRVLNYLIENPETSLDKSDFSTYNCINIFYKIHSVYVAKKLYAENYQRVKFNATRTPNQSINVIPNYSSIFLGYIFDTFKLKSDNSYVSHDLFSKITTELYKTDEPNYKFKEKQFISIISKYQEMYNMCNYLCSNYPSIENHKFVIKSIFTESTNIYISQWYTKYSFDQLFHFTFFNSLNSELFTLLGSSISKNNLKDLLNSKTQTGIQYLHQQHYTLLKLMIRFNINLNTVWKSFEKNEYIAAKSSDYSFHHYYSMYLTSLYMVLGRMNYLFNDHLSKYIQEIHKYKQINNSTNDSIINDLYLFSLMIHQKIMFFEEKLEVSKSDLSKVLDYGNNDLKLYIIFLLREIIL